MSEEALAVTRAQAERGRGVRCIGAEGRGFGSTTKSPRQYIEPEEEGREELGVEPIRAVFEDVFKIVKRVDVEREMPTTARVRDSGGAE